MACLLRPQITLLFLFLCASAAFAQQEEEAVTVYRTLRPSVVVLRNSELFGTGILLDERGLILTNAHVVSSPAPMKVEIEVPQGEEFKRFTFSTFKVVGFHPVLDLALVSIDPREHDLKLFPARLAKTRPVPGQRIYAIGNPDGAGTILAKTITSGMLSAVDREMDGQLYYQFSAPINPGNSGGPLCDRAGQVLGLVTFKMRGGEGIGFAIPLDKLDTGKFVPLYSRKSDPAKAREMLNEALTLHRESERMQGDRQKGMRAYAMVCYQLALSHDPANADCYCNMGMLLRGLGEEELAAAYLMRAIQISPWLGNDARCYTELARCFNKQGKTREALICWTEGLCKFPSDPIAWEDVAILYEKEKDYLRSAQAAALSVLLTPGGQRTKAKSLRSWCESHLDRADLVKTTHAALTSRLREMQNGSDRAREARRLYLTSAFAELVKQTGGPEYPDAARNISPRPQGLVFEDRSAGSITISPARPSSPAVASGE